MSPEVHAPGWEWYYIGLYFFFGGVSAGAYFIGSLAEFFGGGRHRGISRTAFYIAFPTLLVTPPLLIGDLGQPLRFWHLLFDARSGFPYVNLSSPMSVGSWALVLYGAMALLSFLDNLVAEGVLDSAPFAKLYSRLPRKVYAAVGSAAGFFIAGYTGVLLNVTARPLWALTDPLVGALFIASAGSTGAAAIYLVMKWRRIHPGPELEEFERFDRIVKILEIALAVAIVIAAGKYAGALFRGPYAVMFWGGAILLGTLVPLASNVYAHRPGRHARSEPAAVLMACLVLLGGLLLRISLVQAGQL
jgi:formate-dependent nitrite reductase membrane component NrfD